jgi:hypothetical protein
MPWKEICVSNEKIKFIAQLLDEEKMTHLCEEYGISYKIWNRYRNAISSRAIFQHLVYQRAGFCR